MGIGPQLGFWSAWARNTTPSWIQTAIMLLGAIAFYRKATARSEDIGAVLLS
jgi:hypothetical protein